MHTEHYKLSAKDANDQINNSYWESRKCSLNFGYRIKLNEKIQTWDSPVWLPFITVCGRHDVALVCINGLHNSALFLTCFGGEGWTITSCDAIVWT